MTAPTTSRMWTVEEKPAAPEPVILVSSRDGAEVPFVRSVVKLVKVAESHGWTARQTYALAEMTGKRGAYQLGSVVVRLARDGLPLGFAIWHQRDNDGWRFGSAQIRLARHTFRELLSTVGS